MTRQVLILVPHGALGDDRSVVPGCSLVEWHVADDLVRALGGVDSASTIGVVLMADHLPEPDAPAVIAAVRASPAPVVVVQSEQWDGFAPWPLAAASKGAISGFGPEAVWAAAAALRE